MGTPAAAVNSLLPASLQYSQNQREEPVPSVHVHQLPKTNQFLPNTDTQTPLRNQKRPKDPDLFKWSCWGGIKKFFPLHTTAALTSTYLAPDGLYKMELFLAFHNQTLRTCQLSSSHYCRLNTLWVKRTQFFSYLWGQKNRGILIDHCKKPNSVAQLNSPIWDDSAGKVPVTKPDNLRWISGSHMIEDNQLHKVVLWPPHECNSIFTCIRAHARVHTHTHTKIIKCK